MFKLDKIKHQLNNQQEKTSQENNIDLRLIGDRASGKTTYLAALVRWPNSGLSKPVRDVIPIDNATEKLADQARNILEQGLRLEPSILTLEAESLNNYNLTILLETASGNTKLNIHCKDYAGEFFSDLLYQPNNAQFLDYIEDVEKASGIMFLVDGTAHRKDEIYANGIDKLLNAIESKRSGTSQLRLALCLTKCEQPELWVNRLEPSKLVQARFPSSFRKLQSWKQRGVGNFECFTTSAFGNIGTQFPEPNAKKLKRRESGTQSILKYPSKWKPFGLVSPLYWLSTGKRHLVLDKDL